MVVQSVWKSVLFWIGFLASCSEGILGVLMTMGIIEPDVAGSITTAFAIILAFCNANNPSSANQFIMKQGDEQAAMYAKMPVQEQTAMPQSQPYWHDIEG